MILAVRGLSLAVREDGEDGEDPMGRGEIMGCRTLDISIDTRPGKRLQKANWKDPPCLMGKSTSSMAMASIANC